MLNRKPETLSRTITARIHATKTPSQLLVRLVDLAFRLNRGSTLLQLIPEVQAILTSKQERLASEIAIDVLAAIRRVIPLTRSSTVAFRWALEGDCSVGVAWIFEGDGLRWWRGWRDVGEGLDVDGCGLRCDGRGCDAV